MGVGCTVVRAEGGDREERERERVSEREMT